MSMQARAWGIAPGRLSPGETNTIMDVEGVGVGHVTFAEGSRQTGVTAVLPHQKNMFLEKVPAATHVINGFGKSTGLLQIQELGSLETPVILSNTFSVGSAYQALVDSAIKQNPEIGRSTGTVNPAVFECNDGVLNDIHEYRATASHVHGAIQQAQERAEQRAQKEIQREAHREDRSGAWQAARQKARQDTQLQVEDPGKEGREEGAVGAGRGMCCYGLKGGIGSSSRRFELKNRYASPDVSGTPVFTLGALVLTNFGSLKDLRIEGRALGTQLFAYQEIRASLEKSRPRIPEGEQGSVIVLLATDAPLSSRQLGRIARRASAGLNRTGSFIAGGSGEIALAFSTAYTIPHFPTRTIVDRPCVHEDLLDWFFLAAVESVEEAVLNSLIAAERVEGRDGHVRCSLADYLSKLGYSYSGLPLSS